MFDGQVLHDLKNPLSGITGSVGLFLEGMLGPLGEDQKKQLENIDFAAKKLALLLAELTFINDAEQGGTAVAPAPFPTAELRPELAWVKQLAAKEDKTIADSFDDKLSLRADKGLTLMVIQDLLLNAVKQIDRGRQATFNIKQDKDRLLFEIIYDGEGIPKEFLAKVFDKDFRAKHQEFKTKASPGLGFYACKLAIEAQGGQIGFESQSGRSRAYFYLPAVR
jgi:NtrC-family two-component system sensor histidine kinase KinB